MKDKIRNQIRTIFRCGYQLGKWIVFALLVGTVVGLVGTAFYYSLFYANGLRREHPWIIYFLPLGGVAIVGAYQLLKNEKDSGTNLVISSIHSGDYIPFRMTPLIFFSTVVTHFLGGSAGREGAALQLGGSLGNAFGKVFRFDEKDKHILVMCGMSAAFSALFGTPMAAAIFSMEVVSVGIMHYSALVPCVISALVAHGIAGICGVEKEAMILESVPGFGIASSAKIALLAILCGLLSILFCIVMHKTSQAYGKLFKNRYLRIIAGGCIIVLLTLLVGDQTYNGAGMNIVELSVHGDAKPWTFILKMLFTALTLGAGFKGGEIVPSFATGAAFGCLFGNLFGFSPSLCAATGMISVFCGVTNSPITALLISFELFGYEPMPFFLLAVALSYAFSGYFGLYKTQKIIYSKYKTDYINITTSDI